MSHQKNAGQDHKIHTADKTMENVSMFKYLGMTVTSINKLIADRFWGMTDNTWSGIFFLLAI
jgi:hypothetical protein